MQVHRSCEIQSFQHSTASKQTGRQPAIQMVLSEHRIFIFAFDFAFPTLHILAGVVPSHPRISAGSSNGYRFNDDTCCMRGSASGRSLRDNLVGVAMFHVFKEDKFRA